MSGSFRVVADAMDSYAKKVEVVANNIANSNTVGFKKSDMEFSDFLIKYTYKPTADESPTGKSLGSGVKISGTDVVHRQGSLRTSDNELHWAIDGAGFFKLIDPVNGQSVYSRNGNFRMDDQGRVVNSGGFLLDPPIQLSATQQLSHVSNDGKVWVKEAGSGVLTTLTQLNITNFPNPSGLELMGNSLYRPTSASGSEIQGAPQTNGLGSITSRALELSNVNIVDEMVELITSHKAYDTNAKVITAEEKMESIADLIK